MPADGPTILATSGGFLPEPRNMVRPGPLLQYAIELSRPERRPKLCFVNTADGDQTWWIATLHSMYYRTDVDVSTLQLFTMPNVPDMAAHLLAQDTIWVGGGSTANLLALWRLHGLVDIFRTCWESGIVLSGVSAGSLCWHVGGTTDSFGPDLRPVTDALGFLPYSNCPHYDSEEQRRPLFQRLIADGTLPSGFATDNGVGLVYRGTEMVEAVAEVDGAAAYWVARGSDGGVVEEAIAPRRLPDHPPTSSPT